MHLPTLSILSSLLAFSLLLSSTSALLASSSRHQAALKAHATRQNLKRTSSSHSRFEERRMRPIKSSSSRRGEGGVKKKFLLKKAKKGLKVRAGEEATVQCLSSLTFALCDLAGCTDMGPVAAGTECRNNAITTLVVDLTAIPPFGSSNPAPSIAGALALIIAPTKSTVVAASPKPSTHVATSASSAPRIPKSTSLRAAKKVSSAKGKSTSGAVKAKFIVKTKPKVVKASKATGTTVAEEKCAADEVWLDDDTVVSATTATQKTKSATPISKASSNRLPNKLAVKVKAASATPVIKKIVPISSSKQVILKPKPTPVPTVTPVHTSVKFVNANLAAVKAANQAAAPTTSESVSTSTTSSKVVAPSPTHAANVVNSANGPFTGGFATFFTQEGGYGACGHINPDSAFIVALQIDRYGTGSNNAPDCGRSLTIKNMNNGKTITATVADACPGCSNYDSLDLSVGAFNALSDPSVGVIPIIWSFTD